MVIKKFSLYNSNDSYRYGPNSYILNCSKAYSFRLLAKNGGIAGPQPAGAPGGGGAFAAQMHANRSAVEGETEGQRPLGGTSPENILTKAEYQHFNKSIRDHVKEAVLILRRWLNEDGK